MLSPGDGRVDDLLAKAQSAGIFAGLPLGRWYPELEDCLLVAVTEKRTKAEIDALVEVAGEVRSEGSVSSAAAMPHATPRSEASVVL